MKIALIVLAAVAVIAALRFRPPAASPSFVAAAPAPPAAASRAARHGGPVAASGPLVVYVAGAVEHPGLITLPAGSRIDLAVRRAVPLAGADLVAVNLAERVTDGEEIAVPMAGERLAAAATARRRGSPRNATSGTRRHRSSRSAKSSPPSAAVDLNRADAAALATLPGVGSRLAERIVAFREANGPFETLDDLTDVAGVSDRALDALAPYVTVGR